MHIYSKGFSYTISLLIFHMIYCFEKIVLCAVEKHKCMVIESIQFCFLYCATNNIYTTISITDAAAAH